MRITQFIGLNEKGQKFSEKLTFIPSDNHTRGMFNEKIELNTWKNKNNVIYEKFEQYSVWSSGPMIVTAIRIKKSKQVIKKTLWHREPFKPTADYEVNPITGHYNL